jgi:hypothetical protein
MLGPLTRMSRPPRNALGLALFVIVMSGVFVAFITYQAWRSSCVSRERGLKGEVMQSAKGLLYFNGQCWTRRPLPPTDAPF